MQEQVSGRPSLAYSDSCFSFLTSAPKTFFVFFW